MLVMSLFWVDANEADSFWNCHIKVVFNSWTCSVFSHMTARARVRVPSCYFVISARVWEGAEPARNVKFNQVLKLKTGTRGLEDCCHVNSIIPNTQILRDKSVIDWSTHQLYYTVQFFLNLAVKIFSFVFLITSTDALSESSMNNLNWFPSQEVRK